MKAILIVALVALASATYEPTRESFRVWTRTFHKLYTIEEAARRYAVWLDNLAAVKRLNAEGDATYAPNQFSDLTSEEFAAYNTARFANAETKDMVVVPDTNADDVDYRYMLPGIKDQASCGSCWAFSAVANMEGQTYMNNSGKVVSLSEQQLVSCDKVDSGCNGGEMYAADEYAIKNGMAAESAYPYVSGSGVVPACKKFTPVAFFSDNVHWGKIAADATIIEHLEQYGPLSIGVAASGLAFQMYSGGVLDSTMCGTAMDHGIAMVGYGKDTSSGKNYWLVRNSWGTSWGEKGYGKIVRGKNMCAINGDLSTIMA